MPDDPQQTLTFRGKLSEQDVVEMQRYRDLLRFGAGAHQFVVIAFMMPAIVAVGSIMVVGPNVYGFGLLIAANFVIAYYPMHRLAQARRKYRKLREYYQETTVTLSPDRVLIEAADYRGEMRWKPIGLVADTAAGLMFCNSELAEYFWLPKRLLTDEARQLALDWAARRATATWGPSAPAAHFSVAPPLWF